MGILNEMFGDESSDIISPEGELLAKGSYESDPEKILAGYKIYQKRYVFRSLVIKLLVVIVAMASSIMMIITSSGDEVMPVFCLMICIAVGVWFVSQPITNKKNLSKGLESLSGISYETEFYTDKVKISTVAEESGEIAGEKEAAETEISEAETAAEEKVPDGEEDDEAEEPEEIPATVIHLDSPIVDILDREDMFILVVKKAYVFIIPKSAFSKEDSGKIREKLSAIMGIRYKAV